MVHYNRTASKAIAAKSISPMRNMESNKHGISASPADSFLRNTRLTVPSSSAMSSSSGQERSAYHYSNMVNNEREKFNSLHFC